MDREPKRVANPAAHQTSKVELNEGVGIDATPEALAWARDPRRRQET